MHRWLRTLDVDRELVRASFPVLAVRVSAAAASFLLAVIVARLLGARDAGVFYLVVSIALIGAAVGQLGLGDTLMRFIAADRAGGRSRSAARTYRTGLGLAAAATVTVGLLLFALAGPMAGLFELTDESGAFRWAALAVIPVVVVTINSRVLMGLDRPLAGAITLNLIPPAAAGAALVVLAVDSPDGAAALWTAVFFLVAVGGVVVLLRVTRHPDGTDRGAPVGTLLRSSLPLLVVAAGTLAITWTDTLMLGALRTAEDVGVYNSARQAAAVIGLVLLALNSVVAPRFSALFEAGRLDELARLARGAARLGALVAAPALLIALIVPTVVLGVFGSEFVEGDNVLRLLAVAQFINVAAGAVGYVLIMTGNELGLSYTLLIAVALNLVLNLSLIPPLGMEGAAIATAASLAAFNLLAAWGARRAVGAWTIPGF
jgi:O-antigen/teichoic acid export membrane protein